MGFLRFLIILGIALAVPAFIIATGNAATASDPPRASFPPAARVKYHAHFEQQPLALVLHTGRSLG